MGEMNRVVARFQDGQVLKGFTTDFLPAKDRFHLAPEEQTAGARPVEVRVADLKALFFVKSFAGDPAHEEANDPAAAGPGRKIRVVFRDGEILVGTTQGYDKSRPGFFVIPSDRGSNNERCFVVAAAAGEVAFI
jgi:hypothetical protein